MSEREGSILGQAQAGLFEQGLHRLLSASAKLLVRDAAPGPFLDWIVREGPVLGAGMLPAEAQGGEGPDARQLMRLFGHMIYAMLPLPQHGFQPLDIGLPGQDQHCLCGAARPFRHCCEPVLDTLPKLPPEMAMSHVLDALGKAHWAGLPAQGVAPRLVEAAAEVYRHQRRFRDGVLLLEPWAAQPGTYPDAWAALLDLLGDLYADLRRPRKRRALALAMIARGEGAVQSKGWQRLCLMATDAGRRAEAAHAFEQAQRLAPDDVALPLLELSMLLGFGDTALVAQRAQFHMRRLVRMNTDGRHDDLIAGVREMGERGQRFLEDVSLAHEPELARLDAWAAALAPAQLRLRLDCCTPEDLGELTPAQALAEPLQRWAACAATEGTLAWSGFVRWMDVLAAAPLLGDSFEVLDALLAALQSHPSPGAPAVARRLGARAMALWGQLRAQFPRAACRWAARPNQPALRLLAQHVVADTTAWAEHSFDWLCHLVEVLNPSDENGLRMRLAAVLLRRGLYEPALALSQRHPDDTAEMALAHVLALWHTGQRSAAAARLAGILRGNPALARVMRAARPTRRQEDAGLAGPLRQARLAYAEQWDLWQDPELREMLLAVSRRTGSSR
ncbi:MAG TPA: hypothetical protein VFL86_00040 [Burkholderiaceae bacterium]|nr:hypothetical protein [Burkholderiaceae bacterium]